MTNSVGPEVAITLFSNASLLAATAILLAGCDEATRPDAGREVEPARFSHAPPTSWSSVASMSTGRYVHGSATGTDGRIYVIGGADASFNFLSSVEVYDPVSNTWATVASLPGWRYAHGVAAGTDGHVYALGGYTGVFENTVLAYEIAANTWSSVASMTSARYLPGVATGTDGRIYVIGGHDGSGPVATAEVYDPATNTWSPIASMSTGRYAHSAATGTDGRIYVIGGTLGLGGISSVEAYNPISNTWATLASLPAWRYGHGVASGADGHVYALGGYTGSYESTVLAYDIAANTWSSVASMTSVRYLLGAAIGTDGRIYATGGYNGSTAMNTVETYATQTVVEVEIDIMPGSGTNPINPKKKGLIPVAILSTAEFDAVAEVDQSSLTFGRTGDEASWSHCQNELQDVDGNGYNDLLCYFRIQDTGFQPGDTEGVLKGELTSGGQIEGLDAVRVK